jgi:hypothetical protein
MWGINGMSFSGQEWEAMMVKKVLVFSLLVSALFTVGATNVSAEGESIDYSKVLQIYMPGAQWSLNGDGCCDQLTIHDGSVKPTKAELDAFWQNRVASGAPLTPPPPPPTPVPDSLSLDYSKILSRRFPGMQWSLNGDGCCDQLTIHDGSVKPTKAQLDAMWSSVEQEILAEMRSGTYGVSAPTPPPSSLSLDYSKILSRRFPGMQWSLNGDGCCDQLTIHDGSVKPTKAQLDAMWSSVEQEILAEMQAAYRAATGVSAGDDPAAEEESVTAPVAASRTSFVVQSGSAQRSQMIETKAITVRGGYVYLNVAPKSSAGPSQAMVLRATNGKKTFIWYLDRRVGEPRVIGLAKRFVGFRFTLRDGGRVTERIRFVR